MFDTGITGNIQGKGRFTHTGTPSYDDQVGTAKSGGDIVQRMKTGHHFLDLHRLSVFAYRMRFEVQVQNLTDVQEVTCAAGLAQFEQDVFRFTDTAARFGIGLKTDIGDLLPGRNQVTADRKAVNNLCIVLDIQRCRHYRN